LKISERIYAEQKIVLSAIDLNKMFLRMEKQHHAWLKEPSIRCYQQAIRNYEQARKNFHAKQKESGYKKMRTLRGGTKILEGLPQIKKKGKCTDSFYVEGDGVRPLQLNGNKIKLPKIGWVKTSELIPQDANIKNCTISRKADQWFLSYKTEFTPTKHNKTTRVGVDLGIKTFATISDGTSFETPKRYKTLQSKLRREQKSLSRKYEAYKATKKTNQNIPYPKKSNNYVKNQDRVARLHKRIADHRNDATHKLTSYLAKNHGTVVIEDLNVKGMMKNKKLAKHISNVNFGEFRRQMTYKGEWYGCEVIIADRFYPSSKKCNCCGELNRNLTLKDRTWVCANCGTHHDRDLNASINLRDYPIGGYAASSAVKACGDGSSAHVAHSPSVKQEVNFELT